VLAAFHTEMITLDTRSDFSWRTGSELQRRSRILQRIEMRGGLVSIDLMVGLWEVGAIGAIYASSVSHPEPYGPAARCAAEENKADPSEFDRQNHRGVR
jgi:hypothetical protein